MVCGNTVSDEAGTSMQLSRTTMMNAYKNINMFHFFTRLMSHDQEQPVNYGSVCYYQHAMMREEVGMTNKIYQISSYSKPQHKCVVNNNPYWFMSERKGYQEMHAKRQPPCHTRKKGASSLCHLCYEMK
jgi:hypothetical protein